MASKNQSRSQEPQRETVPPLDPPPIDPPPIDPPPIDPPPLDPPLDPPPPPDGFGVEPDVELMLVLSRSGTQFRVLLIERERGAEPIDHTIGYVGKQKALAECMRIVPKLQRFLASGKLLKAKKGFPL